MTKKTAASTEAADLRALLATVLDAITLPYDTDDYDRRVLHESGIRQVVQRREHPDVRASGAERLAVGRVLGSGLRYIDGRAPDPGELAVAQAGTRLADQRDERHPLEPI